MSKKIPFNQCLSPEDKLIQALRAENEALKQQAEQGKRDAVPEGWAVVPIEPTRYQLDEAHNGPLLASDETMDAKTEEWLIDMYKAFVRAAPKQEK